MHLTFDGLQLVAELLVLALHPDRVSVNKHQVGRDVAGDVCIQCCPGHGRCAARLSKWARHQLLGAHRAVITNGANDFDRTAITLGG